MSAPTDRFHDIEAAIAAGSSIAAPKEIAPGLHAYVVPTGYRLEAADAEAAMEAPRRAKGSVRPATLDSLIAYVELHGGADTSVWVHPTCGRVVAVLDDHAAGGHPGHGEHRAFLDMLKTPEWAYWTDNDSRTFDQSSFAEHIEDGGREIVDPDPATMLEIASTFHAVSGANFRSARRLTDGTTQMQYDETIEAKAGTSGTIEIPSEFKLAIAPFVGGPKYAVTARLRYRVNSGRLSLSYKLDRPDDVVRDALAEVAKTLGEKFDRVFVGDPR